MMDLPRLQDWAPDPNTSYPITVMPIEVQQMAEETDGILAKWKVIHADNRSARTPPDVLYHYTDVHGLHGIAFSPCQLWLTDFRSTNDPTEGRHARMLLEKSIQKHLPPVLDSALNHIFHAGGDDWEELFRAVNSLDRRFFTSFSECANELSQWVHYGARGAGYCIGMKSDLLLKQKVAAGSVTLKPHLIPVEYDSTIQLEITERFIGDIAACHKKHEPILSIHQHALSVMYGQFEKLVRWFARAYALEFKNSHFVNEREWRYVVEISPFDIAATPPLRTRVKGTGITWFLTINGCTPHAIIAGPKVDYEQFRDACDPFLQAHLNGVPLSRSDIPLR